MNTILDAGAARHLTASAVVLDVAARRVLLVHHRGADQWLFPGGHVEPGEAPHETAVREVAEETGVRAALLPPLLSLPNMTALPTPFVVAELPAPAWPDEHPHTHIDILYLAVADSSTPLTAQQDEVAGVVWAHVDQLHLLNTREEVEYLTLVALRTIGMHQRGMDTLNIATGSARVGMQFGSVTGGVHLRGW